jgi:hypothetical protein
MSKTTQQFLNHFNSPTPTLVEDGILGAKSKEQITVAITKLKSEFAKRMWQWNDFNFIGIRTDNDFDDTFEDWFVIVAYDTLVAVPASTVAGVTSVWKYLNLWIRGRAGVGTIMENQQIDYLLVEPRGDSWTSWTGGLGFLYQDKPINVYRGALQDGGKWYIDRTNPVMGDIGGGFNVHSWNGFNIWTVNNLSEGCNVTRHEYWNIIFPLLVKNARSENGQKRITYSLIQL